LGELKGDNDPHAVRCNYLSPLRLFACLQIDKLTPSHYIPGMESFELRFHIEIDREDDGRWFAAVVELPGVMAYGATEDEALANVKVLAMEVLTDRLGRGEDLYTGLALQDDRPRSEYLAAFSGLGFIPVPVAL
jgi:predicted RNase H-like HicB family nuclease